MKSYILRSLKKVISSFSQKIKYTLNSISPQFTVKLIYIIKFRKRPNLKNPKTFSEKLVWLRFFYPQMPDVVLAADKAGIHEYLKKKKLNQLAIPLIGIYDKTSDIAWDKLPKQFVIKISNGCGMNIIVTDKDKFSQNKIWKQIDKWKKIDYGRRAAEPHYSKAPSKIVIEQFIEGIENDWKIFCINGVPKMIQVNKDIEINNRNVIGKKYDLLLFTDLNGVILVRKRDEGITDFQIGTTIELPSDFDQMIEYAKKLSESFPLVRVDFFHHLGKIVLGEMTFTPGGGLSEYNQEIQKWLGDALKLPMN